jgi:hypothetical protein
MSEPQKNNWYKTLLSRLNNMSEEFGLDDMQTVKFRDFAVALAKEQFKTGNKCGAAWAFQQARERGANV